jgi:N-acetyl-beta-hexosaminidase
VVISLTSYSYLNFPYSKISTMKAYGFEPIPAGLIEEEAKHILGTQANFWSACNRNEVESGTQLVPRVLATAEVAWSRKDQRDEARFRSAVQRNGDRLKMLGIPYFQDPTIWPSGHEDLAQ